MSKQKVRVGILGLGRIGRGGHGGEISKFPDMFEIAAGCDYDYKRREDLPEIFKNATIYERLDDMLADPTIDLITVATRNVDHTPHAIAAMQAGKCVVVEKPIAVSYAQALELKIADERYPGKLFFRHNRRFEPAFKHVKKIVDSGLLGEVYAVKVHRHPGMARRYDWQTTGACFGGLLNNWGPHLIDQALMLLGAPVKDLWCDLQHAVAAGTADDYFKIMLRGENGRVADVEVSGNTTLPGILYYAEGNRGSLVVELTEKTIKLRHLPADYKFTPLDSELANGHMMAYGGFETLPMIDEEIPIEPGALSDLWPAVYRAMREGIPFPVTIEQALEVVRITDMARAASGFTPTPIKAYYEVDKGQ